jgi:hypothetical protein
MGEARSSVCLPPYSLLFNVNLLQRCLHGNSDSARSQSLPLEFSHLLFTGILYERLVPVFCTSLDGRHSCELGSKQQYSVHRVCFLGPATALAEILCTLGHNFNLVMPTLADISVQPFLGQRALTGHERGE